MVGNKIIVTMKDGSIFVMPDGAWVKAFRIKYSGSEKEALRLFKEAVTKHWKARTVPTKFGFDFDWEEEYSDHASLGMEVMYVDLRAALMAVVMEEDALERGEKTQPKVIGIGEDSITEYTGHGKREMSMEDFLSDERRRKSAGKRADKKVKGKHQ